MQGRETRLKSVFCSGKIWVKEVNYTVFSQCHSGKRFAGDRLPEILTDSPKVVEYAGCDMISYRKKGYDENWDL